MFGDAQRMRCRLEHLSTGSMMNPEPRIEEQAVGSEVSAIEDLLCTDDDGDALINLTRDYLHPSQSVTLRWEVSRATS